MAFNGVALGERFRLETEEASFANRESCKNNSGTNPAIRRTHQDCKHLRPAESTQSRNYRQ